MPNLTADRLQEIATRWPDKVVALVPVTCLVAEINSRAQWSLGVAVANEKGYHPLPWTWCFSDDYDEIADFCDKVNLELFDISPRLGAKIVTSTM